MMAEYRRQVLLQLPDGERIVAVPMHFGEVFGSGQPSAAVNDIHQPDIRGAAVVAPVIVGANLFIHRLLFARPLALR